MTVPESALRAAALAEHDEVVAAFVGAVERIRERAWHLPPAPGRWSAAALSLHVADAYEYGRQAAAGRATMKLRVPAPLAWGARTFLLPRMLDAKRFPKGARVPDEVEPDLAVAAELSKPTAIARLTSAAEAARKALLHAHDTRTGVRVVHAYFGALPPLAALRLLSAHTRHHAAGIAARDVVDAGHAPQ